ncbi:MAG: hypothetical protein Q8P18_27885 [Pseudomonadota bacterium]|nr:hypothetical protein [Pseudomonadota bacterium]
MLLLSALLTVSSSNAAATQAARLRVVGELVQESSLAAGQASSGSVMLHNDGTTPVQVVVYPRDAAADESSAAVVGSNRAWLRFTPRLVTVDPGGSAELPYRVEVPADAEVAGAYGTVLVIEPTAAPVWPPPADPAAETAVEGYRVNIVTHVSPWGSP